MIDRKRGGAREWILLFTDVACVEWVRKLKPFKLLQYKERTSFTKVQRVDPFDMKWRGGRQSPKCKRGGTIYQNSLKWKGGPHSTKVTKMERAKSFHMKCEGDPIHKSAEGGTPFTKVQRGGPHSPKFTKVQRGTLFLLKRKGGTPFTKIHQSAKEDPFHMKCK